jgi:hypothetical protein
MGDGSRCYACNEFSEPGSGACKRHGDERFTKHLENASKIVASWPLWKQRILGSLEGGKLMGANYQCQIKISESKTGEWLRYLPPLTVFRLDAGNSSRGLWMTLGFQNEFDDERDCILIKGSDRNFATVKSFASDTKVEPLKSKLVIGEEDIIDDEEEEEEKVCPSCSTAEEFFEKRFLDAIKNLPTEDPKHLPPGYYLQHRYQDSGWIDLDERYTEPGTAIDKACKYSRDAIAYGMTRVLDHKGNIVKTFTCGKEI